MSRHTIALWFVTLLVVSTSVPLSGLAQDDAAADSVIFLIGDGMGYAQVTAARWENAGGSLPDYSSLDNYQNTRLYMDDLDYAGHMSTHSLNSFITDSAAAVTALATGEKTYNGVISVTNITDRGAVIGYENATLYAVPLTTILELADEAGKSTGVVSTTRLTHATPAGYYAHSADRDWENEIAEQCISSDMEVAMGGGNAYFLPQTVDGSKRTDDRNLMTEAEDLGWTVATNSTELQAIDAESSDRVLGLFTSSHMSYEMERGDDEPSIAEMTQAAIDVLSKDEDGFFLMVEGGRIDHADHARDYENCVIDTIAFDDAIKVALDYAAENPNTLVVVTADHECGGLVLSALPDKDYTEGWTPVFGSGVSTSPSTEYPDDFIVGGEATHTPVDVPLFASGPMAEEFSHGLIDNTEIFDLMKAAMGL